MSIKIEDAKTTLFLTINTRFVHISIWPRAQEGEDVIEFSYGSKTSRIKYGEFVPVIIPLREIGIHVDVLTASKIAKIVRKNIKANQD